MVLGAQFQWAVVDVDAHVVLTPWQATVVFDVAWPLCLLCVNIERAAILTAVFVCFCL